MLVLSRKVREEIEIGPFSDGSFVTVAIQRIAGDKVRIGVDAPREIRILRSELVRRVEGGESIVESQEEAA